MMTDLPHARRNASGVGGSLLGGKSNFSISWPVMVNFFPPHVVRFVSARNQGYNYQSSGQCRTTF